MPRTEIIFFDELGFGWVVDSSIIKKISDCSRQKDILVEKTLADLLAKDKRP